MSPPRERLKFGERLVNLFRGMKLLPYDQFSRLHIRDFLPEEQISEDDTGLEQSPLGFNRCRHVFQFREQWLAFFYAESPPVELAGIDFQLNEGFPVEVANRVLAA